MPQSDLIPKIVKGLLAHRQKGRWENTQENVFILLALDRYFNTYEKASADFVARVWLGDAYAGEQQFKGRATDRFRLNLPMRYLVDQPPERRLTLSKVGTGRLYYRLALNYAPVDLNLKSADYGFTVERTYDPGSRVRVRVTLAVPARRYHVALVDPLPAGFVVPPPKAEEMYSPETFGRVKTDHVRID